MRTILVATLVAGLGLFPAAVSAQSAGGTGNGVQSADTVVPLDLRADRWRYRWHQGYWWYYTPQLTWLIYEKNAWKPFLAPPSLPARPVSQPGSIMSPADRSVFGVDS